MIRKTPLVVLAALAAAVPATAQHVESFGFRLSATVSTIETDLPSEDAQVRDGSGAVLFVQWNGPGRISLVTEASYLERGYQRRQGASPDMIDLHGGWLDRRMQYVSVAALARVPVVRVGPVSSYAVAGPRMNALVGRRGEDVPGYSYSSIVWDGTAGIGLQVRRVPVTFEARYSHGFSDAFSGEGWRGSAHHRAVDYMIGLRF